MKDITLLGIDIAKNVFQLHGVDAKGNAVYKKQLSRAKLLETIAQLRPCTIVMEACGGSSYWCRQFQALGHVTKLISPQFVKPFVKTNKNDSNDAEAICEAASRPSMRYVTPNTIEQQDIQSLHRVRRRLVESRTALVNQIRGLLMEYGIVCAKGISRIRTILPEILEEAQNELSGFARELFAELREEIAEKDGRIANCDKKIAVLFKNNKACQKISPIEGIGPITATAIVAAIGDAKAFKNGRHLAAFLGLVPRQNSSGGKQKLLGISKRGDCYLRSLLIHGARAVIRTIENKNDYRSDWAKGVKDRRGYNRAAVALANKNARCIWAVLSQDTVYRKAV